MLHQNDVCINIFLCSQRSFIQYAMFIYANELKVKKKIGELHIRWDSS